MTNKLLVSVSLKDQILQQHVFDKATIKIGRHRACDIVLDNPAVSRVHVEIRWQDGAAWLHDASSANGVLLNGEPVEDAALADGDVVMIGKFRVHFALSSADQHETTGNLTSRDLTIRVPPRST